MRAFTIGQNEAGQRFDKYLHKLLPLAGSSFLYKMLRKKNITLNDGKAEGREMLKAGDHVKIFFAEDTFLKFAGRDVQAEGSDTDIAEYQKAYQTLNRRSWKPVILLETEDVLILNKPAGILTQKSVPSDCSINEWLIGYLLDSKAINPAQLLTFHPSVCNRLDRNTSGLVLCGKSLAGSQLLGELIRERKVGKFYRTIVKGSIRDSRTIEGFLYKDSYTNQVTVYADPADAGLKNQEHLSAIRTSYTPIRIFCINGQPYTYLEIQLHTGKSHQIRAHLASIGHPILGDTKYGDVAVNQWVQKSFHLSYQLLHAYRVEFPKLTGTGEKLSGQSVIAPQPPVFSHILEAADTKEVRV